MLRLLLLRHAESDWSRSELRDHDRPLNVRGLRDAPRIGDWLRERGLVPVAALASTARRARDTAGLAAPDALRLLPELYGASASELLSVVRAKGGDASPLLVVAHNPGLEELVSRLSGSLAPFPTAALAVCEAPVSRWEELDPAALRVVAVVRPRELSGTGPPSP